ncbi:iron complex transport system substrate-binding protein [Methanohalophilus levihalophilus]|uniref:ABC transporter substrate-binding protein n=1 Tax=Methanohalophilus levihalophilus TaxID=1431282 RepID=UPI001AE8E389|nr:ABC transporter substrate-binding protein [Methanohalophilus levihalophilus]MBP2030542.1 iron complex transport system substrate-binding protein [Methanohalophilus levihalophilus]
MKKFPSTIMLVTVFVIVLTTCGCLSSDEQTEHLTQTEEAESRTITDAYGRHVEVPEKINYTICIGSGSLRYLCYLGEQDTVVGVEDIEQRPEEIENPLRPYRIANPQFGNKEDYPYIGVFRGDYDAESILMLDPAPEVIFLTYSNAEGADKLSNDVGGIPVIGLNYGDTGEGFDDMKFALTTMGDVMNNKERAEEVIAFFEDEIEDINSRIEGEETVNLYVAGVAYRGSHGILSTQPDYPPFEYINGNNVAASTSLTGDWEGYQIGDDALFQWDTEPGIEYIFVDLSTFDFSENGNSHTNEKYGVDAFGPEGVYTNLEAAKSGNLYGVMPYNWYTTNHGNVLADAWYVGKQVYPDKFEDIDPENKANEIYSFLYSGCPVNEGIYDTMAENFGHNFGKIELQ